LQNRNADGLCEACGKPFPCPTGIAIHKAWMSAIAISSVTGPPASSSPLHAQHSSGDAGRG